MQYNIKAIPTRYAGVNFRSRLEARWAAFFDLANIKWEYEPFDLEGWAPDFLLRTELCNVLCEVKPVDLSPRRADTSAYEKAKRYWRDYQILMLGIGPIEGRSFLSKCFGLLMDEPDSVDYSWVDMTKALASPNQEELWREAGNITQWSAPDVHHEEPTHLISISEIIQRGLDRANRSAA